MTRYIVLAWLWDHWGVTFSSNLKDAAQEAFDSTKRYAPTVLLDFKTLEVWK
jgi:hypothetical protein